MTNTLIIITIIAYLAFMVAIGIFSSRKTKNTGDYYLGGRRLGPLVTAMSAEASDMSSWLLMGLPGLALTAGIAEAFWTAIGLFIGTYLNWLIVAKRLRKYSEKTNSTTIPDFFSNRFRDKSGTLLAISAIFIIVFFVPYTASGFSAVGKLFNTLFGVDYHVAMIIGGIIICIYTV
ncbi:MAG: sodium:proline symporter, partial [Clostridia bacterium]|nr:sodium:proline symporter [Clostridia bacterium]